MWFCSRNYKEFGKAVILMSPPLLGLNTAGEISVNGTHFTCYNRALSCRGPVIAASALECSGWQAAVS